MPFDTLNSVAEFSTLGDMKNVITKLNGKEFYGRNIRIVDDRDSRFDSFVNSLEMFSIFIVVHFQPIPSSQSVPV